MSLVLLFISERAYCLHSVTIFDASPTDENIRIIATGENSCL